MKEIIKLVLLQEALIATIGSMFVEMNACVTRALVTPKEKMRVIELPLGSEFDTIIFSKKTTRDR